MRPGPGPAASRNADWSPNLHPNASSEFCARATKKTSSVPSVQSALKGASLILASISSSVNALRTPTSHHHVCDHRKRNSRPKCAVRHPPGDSAEDVHGPRRGHDGGDGDRARAWIASSWAAVPGRECAPTTEDGAGVVLLQQDEELQDDAGGAELGGDGRDEARDHGARVGDDL
ncbi:hypothetical protein EVG20_g916 [Dentipellis fragilis]|uniref:Uncharacterized protein n=1 Tax=Dentipellis fragilis TaxID=205917 RepID=A0A4Y9ZBA1_9AGAM|nr:hypothetical protein EVG20_g916 [Dentipellis fragilis]